MFWDVLRANSYACGPATPSTCVNWSVTRWNVWTVLFRPESKACRAVSAPRRAISAPPRVASSATLLTDSAARSICSLLLEPSEISILLALAAVPPNSRCAQESGAGQAGASSLDQGVCTRARHLSCEVVPRPTRETDSVLIGSAAPGCFCSQRRSQSSG